MRSVIPGMGVCKYCDATSVPRGCLGAEIDGGQCLGCGAPIYAILERKKPEVASGEEVMAGCMCTGACRVPPYSCNGSAPVHGQATLMRPFTPLAVADAETDTPPRTIVPAVNDFAYIRQREKEIAAEREAAKPRELEYPAGDFA